MMEREGYLLSGLLHIGVILLFWLGIPYLFQDPLLPPPTFSVDFVTEEMVQASTNVSEEEPKEDPSPPQPEEKPEKKKQQEVATSKAVETQEDLAKVEEDILSLLDDDVIEDLTKPQKVVEKKPVVPPKPKPKPKKLAQKKPEKKKKNEAFDSLLSNVTEKKVKAQPVSHTSGTGKSSEDDITKVLTGSELNLLRQQVASCWNIPAGAQNASDLVVDIHVELDGQGKVRVAQVVGGNQAHPYFRAGSESAVRALKNPRCNPLKIPPQRLAQMQSFTFRFNPQYMF